MLPPAQVGAGGTLTANRTINPNDLTKLRVFFEVALQKLNATGGKWDRCSESVRREQGAMSDTEQASMNLEDNLIGLAVEGWRFSQVMMRTLSKLDAGEASRHASRLRFFMRKIDESLEAAGFKFVSIEGQRLDPGMPVSALNAGDFGPTSILGVDQMVEPIVLKADGQLRRPGTVTVREVKL